VWIERTNPVARRDLNQVTRRSVEAVHHDRRIGQDAPEHLRSVHQSATALRMYNPDAGWDEGCHQDRQHDQCGPKALMHGLTLLWPAIQLRPFCDALHEFIIG